MSTNPLLFLAGPPRFGEIEPAHVLPAVEQRLAEVEETIAGLADQAAPTWASFVEPLDQTLEALERCWGPVEHLNAVLTSDALREAHRAAKPKIAEHAAHLSQDVRLYKGYKAVLDQADAEGLTPAQRKALENAIRDFHLAGVDLPAEKKERYRALQVELSQLSSRFSDHLVDADSAYRLVLEDPAEVAGLPESVLAAAHAKALEDDAQAPESRWTFTLQMPSYLPFMQYATARARREELYRAYATRCSAGEWDNTPLIDRILELRRELAELLGFQNYAEVSLATKMADTPEHVFSFLHELAEKSVAYGRRDIEELHAFALQRDGLDDMQVWDYAFYREALRTERYSFSDEEVRAYFPLDKVLGGLFETLNRIYGIRLEDVTAAQPFPVWHPHVRTVEVKGPEGEPRGHMLLDLFARDGKRQGAWMGDCVERVSRPGRELQRPIAYLVCNFAAPVGDTPSLLRHGEVQTLFHECGHALHHVLTRVDCRAVSGINNVPWDGVELPSQFHENWVWEAEALGLLSAHHQSGESLPPELLEKMLAAKNFQSGRDMLRQLEFALFDLELHTHYHPRSEQTVHDVIDAVRARVSVLPPPAEDRFENGFSHIFAGGYAAGYYSYKWAEVLAADAYSRFEEEGIFSRDAGQAFLHHILEQGGSADLMELYVAFRGRQPTPEALLRHSGLTVPLS